MKTLTAIAAVLVLSAATHAGTIENITGLPQGWTWEHNNYDFLANVYTPSGSLAFDVDARLVNLVRIVGRRGQPVPDAGVMELSGLWFPEHFFSAYPDETMPPTVTNISTGRLLVDMEGMKFGRVNSGLPVIIMHSAPEPSGLLPFSIGLLVLRRRTHRAQ